MSDPSNRLSRSDALADAPRHGSNHVAVPISISRSCSCSGGASLVIQSAMPGRSGSGRPRTVGISPSRSTSKLGRAELRARAVATTVVPLPPLAAQQRVTMIFPHSACGLGRVHGGSRCNRGYRLSGRVRRCRYPSQSRKARSRSSLRRGGVWVPGGLHRLQSGWDGRSPSGGFDSRPPPP